MFVSTLCRSDSSGAFDRSCHVQLLGQYRSAVAFWSLLRRHIKSDIIYGIMQVAKTVYFSVIMAKIYTTCDFGPIYNAE